MSHRESTHVFLTFLTLYRSASQQAAVRRPVKHFNPQKITTISHFSIFSSRQHVASATTSTTSTVHRVHGPESARSTPWDRGRQEAKHIEAPKRPWVILFENTHGNETTWDEKGLNSGCGKTRFRIPTGGCLLHCCR